MRSYQTNFLFTMWTSKPVIAQKNHRLQDSSSIDEIVMPMWGETVNITLLRANELFALTVLPPLARVLCLMGQGNEVDIRLKWRATASFMVLFLCMVYIVGRDGLPLPYVWPLGFIWSCLLLIMPWLAAVLNGPWNVPVLEIHYSGKFTIASAVSRKIVDGDGNSSSLGRYQCHCSLYWVWLCVPPHQYMQRHFPSHFHHIAQQWQSYGNGHNCNDKDANKAFIIITLLFIMISIIVLCMGMVRVWIWMLLPYGLPLWMISSQYQLFGLDANHSANLYLFMFCLTFFALLQIWFFLQFCGGHL